MSGESTASSRRRHETLSGESIGSTANSSSEDLASIPGLESNYVEEEDDPLSVKKLALSFDYLMYKVSEKMGALAQQTETSVVSRKDEADKQLIDIETSMNNLKLLIRKCDDLDADFTMIEQIGFLVTDFKERVKSLEAQIIKKEGK